MDTIQRHIAAFITDSLTGIEISQSTVEILEAVVREDYGNDLFNKVMEAIKERGIRNARPVVAELALNYILEEGILAMKQEVLYSFHGDLAITSVVEDGKITELYIADRNTALTTARSVVSKYPFADYKAV